MWLGFCQYALQCLCSEILVLPSINFYFSGKTLFKMTYWPFYVKICQGACPACKRQFVGYKNQIICCASCGNIVWQPEGDFFRRDSKDTTSRKSEPEIIDVEFEEK